MTSPLLFRVRLRLSAPLGTPLTSGTLFGHLCWAVRAGEGEAGLIRWLEGQGEAPWAVSDGFPMDLLPRPLLPPEQRMKPAGVKEADETKKRARLAWITVKGFLDLRGALSETALASEVVASSLPGELNGYRLAHNTIDRHRGSTPEEGGLFFVDEDWSHAVMPQRDVYVRAPVDAGEVEDLFRRVGDNGYGRDSTWGRGRFDVEGVEQAEALDGHEGSHRLSLSHGTITPNMLDARYKLFTHFGKVGDLMAAEGVRPWKRPVLLARPGATFRPDGDGPFGALLKGVHQDRPETICHDARHVAIPYTEARP